MLLALARNSDRVLNETLVSAASITLVAVSILWIVLSRLILRNLRKGARVPTKVPRAPRRDIWSAPPRRRR